MPNGKTDAFQIGRETLLGILSSLDEEQLRYIEVRSRDKGEFTPAEVIKLVGDFPENELNVEELHGETYWVLVLAADYCVFEICPDSKSYQRLREYHRGLGK